VERGGAPVGADRLRVCPQVTMILEFSLEGLATGLG
jgi:hypothetical protein